MAEHEKQQTRNLCAQIPTALHARVQEEQERSGKTLGEYMTMLITEYYKWKEGMNMKSDSGETRTLAVQMTGSLFDRVDAYCAKHRLKKKHFITELIKKAMDELEAADKDDENTNSVSDTEGAAE